MKEHKDLVCQRVFDAIVECDGSATVAQLATATGIAIPHLRTAIFHLRHIGYIKTVRPSPLRYELTESAQRPTDQRGKKRK